MFRLFFMAPKFVQRTGSFWTFIHGGRTGNWMEVHSGILKDCSNSRNHQNFSIRSCLSAWLCRLSQRSFSGCLQSKRARGQVPRVLMACPQSHHPTGKGDMGESWSLYEKNEAHRIFLCRKNEALRKFDRYGDFQRRRTSDFWCPGITFYPKSSHPVARGFNELSTGILEQLRSILHWCWLIGSPLRVCRLLEVRDQGWNGIRKLPVFVKAIRCI